MDTPTLFPVIYENPKKQQAYTLFVYRGICPTNIAKITGHTRNEIIEWAEGEDWETRRDEHLTQSRKAAATSVGLQVSSRTRKVIGGCLDIHETLLNQLRKSMEPDPENPQPPSLRQINESAKALATLYGMFSGLLEVGGVVQKGSPVDDDARPPNAPTTLVQVNVLADLVRAGEAKAGFGVQVTQETIDAT